MRKPSPKRDSITELFTKFAGQANTLTIPCPYIDFCRGDHLAALLLSQILYWTDRTEDPDGWFAKSYEDWYEETRLTKRQIMRLIGKDKRQKEDSFSLKMIGVETVVKRSKHYDGKAAMRYRVNFDVLSQHIFKFFETKVTIGNSSKVTDGNSLEVTNAHSSKVTNGNSYTTETTAKTTAKKKSAPAAPPNYVAMQNGMNPQLLGYIDAWKQSAAVNGIEPQIPSGQRSKMLEDAQALQDMGCTSEDWRDYLTERKKARKSTVWNFAFGDVHEYVGRKKAAVNSNVSSIRNDIYYVEETDQTMIFNWEKGVWDYFPGKLESRPA